MKHALFLAWRNLNSGRLRTAILVGCLTVAGSLPIVMHVVVAQFRNNLTQRAESTPLIVGATGSHFDLTLHTLYFEANAPAEITMREAEAISNSNRARPIPLFAKFRAEGFRIVGTSDEYFRFRNLKVDRGTTLQRIGDCVVGAKVAALLEVEPEGHLTSEPENVFDMTGSYPLRMRVTGILAKADSPDDFAIFVSLETAWIIAGRGHGHRNPDDKSHEPTESDEDGSFSPVDPFTEVTDENVHSFHFHGKREDLPLTAIIAVASDQRSETLLIGQYLSRDDVTILEPPQIISQLMQLVFRVESFLDVAAVILLGTTAVLVLLVFALSWQLRQNEVLTLFKLGCSRFMIARILLAELFLIGLITAVLVAVVTGVAIYAGPGLLEQMLTRG